MQNHSILQKYNKIIKRAKQIKDQDKLQLKFFDKQISIKINKI